MGLHRNAPAEDMLAEDTLPVTGVGSHDTCFTSSMQQLEEADGDIRGEFFDADTDIIRGEVMAKLAQCIKAS